MEQAKFYKYAAIFLVLLNLSMVAFFLITKPKHNHGRKGDAKQILQLDKEQNTTFLEYVEIHKKQMKDFNKEQKQVLKTYFETLTDTTNLAITDSLLQQVQVLEKQKIESTYEHIKEVRLILNKEQDVHFQSFMEHALNRILLENQKGQKK